MTKEYILKLLEKFGVIISHSHIVYTSGKHGDTYINKDGIYPHTKEISKLCLEIAKNFMDNNIQVVIAPAIGGVILSQWIAKHLTTLTKKEVLSVYAEKTNDGNSFIIKRGYDKLVVGKNVLVVEDVLTTGGSAKKVVEATRAIGGKVVGLGVLCNRGGITKEDVACVPKLFSLINMKFDAWDEAKCPLCAKNIPINTDVGKGREYLEKKRE